MLEFINEPVGVETRARRDGTPRPIAFTWRGRRYRITAWGREETTGDESHPRRCYLVQTVGAETWELCRDQEGGQWTLSRRWTRPARIV